MKSTANFGNYNSDVKTKEKCHRSIVMDKADFIWKFRFILLPIDVIEL